MSLFHQLPYLSPFYSQAKVSPSLHRSPWHFLVWTSRSSDRKWHIKRRMYTMRIQSRKPLSAMLVCLFATFFALYPSLFVQPTLARNAQQSIASADTNLARLVDPLIGTGQQSLAFHGGDTFPGADVPFGMVQWSPDTNSNPDGGYSYSDSKIKGFSLTHISGAGCNAYGDIPFMPYVGTVSSSPASNASSYMS